MATKDYQALGVKEDVISCIQALWLDGVSTKHFIAFKRLQKLYDKRVTERIDQGEKLNRTSCTASIEDSDLQIFISAGRIVAASGKTITDQQTKYCVASRCARGLDEYQMPLNLSEMKKLVMKMQVV